MKFKQKLIKIKIHKQVDRNAPAGELDDAPSMLEEISRETMVTRGEAAPSSRPPVD